MKSAAEAFRKGYSKKLLAIIDWTMEVDPMYRPQSVTQLLEAINESQAESNEEGGSESMLDRLASSLSWIKGGPR